MNIQLQDITVTARDGRVSHLDRVYIRGSHVRFFIVPDMLRLVPVDRAGQAVWLIRSQKCSHVPFANEQGPWCGYGAWSRDSQSCPWAAWRTAMKSLESDNYY